MFSCRQQSQNQSAMSDKQRRNPLQRQQSTGMSMASNAGLAAMQSQFGNRAVSQMLRKQRPESSAVRSSIEPASTPVVQAKWLNQGTRDLQWDRLISGLRWYYNITTGNMYYTIDSPRQVPPEHLTMIQLHAGQEKTDDEWDQLGFPAGNWDDADAEVVVDQHGGFASRAETVSANTNRKTATSMMNYAEIYRETTVEDDWVLLDHETTAPQHSGADREYLMKAGVNGLHNTNCADPKVQDLVEKQIGAWRTRDLHEGRSGQGEHVDVLHYDDEEPCMNACHTNLEQQAVRTGADIHLFLSQGKDTDGNYEGARYARTLDHGAAPEVLRTRGVGAGLETVLGELHKGRDKLYKELEAVATAMSKIIENDQIKNKTAALAKWKQKKADIMKQLRLVLDRIDEVNAMGAELEHHHQI